MNKIIVITGPTGVGKTKLGVALAREFNGEIISADSRQVYKYMDIGTGKDLAEYGEIKVWGIDLVNPDESFSVAQWRKYAEEKIKDIWERGKLPIVVGGTGLYIKELLFPSQTLLIPPNRRLRTELLSASVIELQNKLQKADSDKWDRMNNSDRNNPRRLLRAIEVAWYVRHNDRYIQPTITNLDSLIIGLTAPIKELARRIDQRVEERMRAGMEAEKERLAEMGYFPDAIGYKEKNPEEWKIHERQYAKRQMTYLAKLPGIKWYIISDGQEAFTACLRETADEVRRFLGEGRKSDRGFRDRR